MKSENEINKELNETIKLLIKLRRPDLYGNIYEDPDDLYDKAQKKAAETIRDFDEFYEYAYEGYSNGLHRDYLLYCEANRMAISYNYILDLCEPDAKVSDYDVNKWMKEEL